MSSGSQSKVLKFRCIICEIDLASEEDVKATLQKVGFNAEAVD